MAKGTINGTTSNEYIISKIEWSSTPFADTNRSVVTASLYYKRTNTGYTTYGTGSFYVSINNTGTTVSKELTIGTSWVLACTEERTVYHNSDGTRKVEIYAGGSISGTTLTSTDCEATVTLDTIARASTITSASNMTLGYPCNIKWTPTSTSLRYKITFTHGSFSYTTATIHPNTTSAYTYTGSDLTVERVAPHITTASKGTMTATLYTYSDSAATKQIGSASSKTFTVIVQSNSSTQPTLTMTLSPVSSLASPLNTLYVQGKTKVDANFSATGKYSATVSSYSMTALGKSYGSPYTSDYLSQSGTFTITGKCTDSRGFSDTDTKKITVIPYSKPSVIPHSGETAVVCRRCTSEGVYNPSAEFLRIKAGRQYSPVTSGGTQHNYCLLRYRYKAESASSFSSYRTLLSRTAEEDEIDVALTEVSMSPTSSYIVQIEVVDDLGETSMLQFTIPTDSVVFHLKQRGKGAAFGKYAEIEKTLDVAEDWNVEVRGGFNPVEIPSGADLNHLTKPNKYIARYTYVPTYLNCPITVQTTFSLEVISMGKDGQLLQRLTRCSEEATVYERQYYSSAWHEWECVNPPMEVGVEYRTKERYMGKVVYTSLINFGALPNATRKLFEHGIEGISQVIRCVGQMSDGNSLPFNFNSTNWVEIYAGGQYVGILTGDDKTKFTAYAQMWYVKD